MLIFRKGEVLVFDTDSRQQKRIAGIIHSNPLTFANLVRQVPKSF